MQFTMNLVANAPAKRQETPGRYLVLLDTGAASSVTLRLFSGSEEIENIRQAKRGLKLTAPEGFSHVEISSTVDAAVELVMSMGRVDVGFIDGVQVNATIVGPVPVPVANDRGSPGNPVNVTAVTVADAPAVSFADLAHVAVNDTLDPLIAINANRKEVRFTNFGPDPVAIGAPATLTWAKRAIVLEVGDTYCESRAANLAWSGITSAAGKNADVGIQEVLT